MAGGPTFRSSGKFSYNAVVSLMAQPECIVVASDRIPIEKLTFGPQVRPFLVDMSRFDLNSDDSTISNILRAHFEGDTST